MNDTALEPVHVSCHYEVNPQAIFDAWVTPKIMRRWLFVGPTSEIDSITMNLEVGGEFSILEYDRTSEDYIDHFGKYLEIEKPLQLVFTLNVPKFFAGETTVMVHIYPSLNGCELKLTQEGVSKDETEKNWLDMLHQLKLVVEEEN